MPIIIALMATLLMSALGAALVLTTSSDALIAANFRDAQQGVYAADAALERAMSDLATRADWNAILDGTASSAFVDGPPSGVRALADGSSLDLDHTLNMMNCRKITACSASNLSANTAQRPWGANNPVWRLFAYGPLSGLLPPHALESAFYVIVMVADDASENDNDPLHDGQGARNPPGRRADGRTAGSAGRRCGRPPSVVLAPQKVTLTYNGFRADNQVAIMRTKATLIVVSAVLLSLGTTAKPLAAQSLADVARKEQDRRKAIKKPAKLLTNKDLKAPVSTGNSTPDGAATAGTDADKSKAAA